MAAFSFPNLYKGFTLFELIFTLSLLVVISLISFPGLYELHKQHRPEVALKHIKHQLMLARAYAVESDENISICGLKGSVCNRDYWHKDITAFIDRNKNHSLDNDEKIIFVIDAIAHQDSLTYPRHAITFKPTGSIKGFNNGTFVYCTYDLEGIPKGLEMSVSNAGRARLRDTSRCQIRL